jgi:hypothetical protein
MAMRTDLYQYGLPSTLQRPCRCDCTCGLIATADPVCAAIMHVVRHLCARLQEHDTPVTVTVIEGKSHTQLMIEDSLRGGPDRTVELILATVRKLIFHFDAHLKGLQVL